MRAIFANTVTAFALDDPRIILLTGDFCFGLFDKLKADRPKQYWNVGTGEQAMVGMAAGLAIGGMLPIVYTITPFLLDRAYEQIKLDVDSQNLKVILVGYDDYPKDGPTHKSVSPITLCSLFRNVHFYGPATGQSATDAIQDAFVKLWPSFIHLRKIPLDVRSEWPAEGRDA